jgi:hypothetical protein
MLKIFVMVVLFSSFLVIDLVYFFPVLIIILIILRTLEQDLKLKDRRRTFRP